MSPRKRKDAYHHGDLRRALLEAGARLLEKTEADALSLREIARAAGVSEAAPYHHFADKAHLMAALAEQGFTELAERSREALAKAGASPRRRLELLGEAYVRFAVERRGHFRVMFRFWLSAEEQPSLKGAAEGAFGALFEVAQAFRHRSPSGDPRDVALSLWSEVHGLAVLWTDGPARDLWAGESFEAVTRRVLATWMSDGASGSAT